MKLGIEVFIQEKKWQAGLENKRVGFVGHNASVDSKLQSSIQLLLKHTPLKISCALGPQHGFKNTKQANMIPTEDQNLCIPKQKPIKIFSLYSSHTRRLTKEMLSHFDVLIIDLQDIGCRVYTYLTTLFYILEDATKAQKEVWILDRPNPAGRTIEGRILNKNFTSFVGTAPLPIRYGMTLAEAARWYVHFKKLNIKLEIIPMQNYDPNICPWPKNLAWTLPSPNMVDEECARCYSGTVLLEGTLVSEARGTVFPLKAFGFPNMKTKNILDAMLNLESNWLKACKLKEEFFIPMFDKYQGQECSAIRIYATSPFYEPKNFRPYRLISLFLKCLKKVHPGYKLWLNPPYEYEYKKMPIDILSGDSFLRNWVEDSESSPKDLEKKLQTDETKWEEISKAFLLYPGKKT